MTNIIKYFCRYVLIVIFICNNSFATDFDNGVDANGDIIVSPTLAQRCGISSTDPQITYDCLKRLAFDYKSGNLVNKEFANYNEERDAIVKDYVASDFEKFVKVLTASADYEDRINALVCIDTTIPECIAPSNDVNTELVYNNKLALDNSTTMLDAVKARISSLQIINMVNILDNVVAEISVDIQKEIELAGPPEGNNSTASNSGE